MIRFRTIALISVLFIGASFAAHPVQAKTVTWNPAPLPTMVTNGGRGYNLNNTNVSVLYGATVTDIYGTILSDGASIPVGSQIIIKPQVHGPQDISWFSTGADTDSPYGYWGSGTPALTCSTNDLFTTDTLPGSGYMSCGSSGCTFVGTTDMYKIYFLALITPPTKSINTSSNLSCGAPASDGSETCTVQSAGPITATVSFAATPGQFYGQQQQNTSNYGIYTGYGACGALTIAPSAISVPQEDISFSFTAPVPPNNPPNTPVLACPATGTTNQAVSFSVSATDPEGDQLRYGINFAGGTTVNQWVPSAGYVNSGTSQGFTHTWSTPGTYNVRALAEDSKSADSAWTSTSGCLVTISNPPAPSATLTASPTTITSGGSTTLQWTCTNSTSASINQGVGAVAPASGGTTSVSPLSTTTYTLTCTGPGGTNTNSTTVTVSPPLRPDLISTSITPTSAVAGTPVSLTATVTNQGNASTGAGFYTLFQSATDASGSNAADIGAQQRPSALGIGASYVASVSKTFASAGTTYVRACADKSSAGDAGVITESDETNNCGSWTAITVSTAISGSCSVTPTSITAGGSATWTASPAGGNGTYTYSWSGTDSLSGSSQSVSKVYASPGTDTASVVISSGGNSATVNCSNSLNVGATQPDITAGPVSPTTATAGVPVTLSSTITNGGNASTGAGFTNLFQKATDSAGSNATDIGTYQRGTALLSSANFSSTLSYTFPAAGTYYVRSCADKASAGDSGQIAESDELNNCGAAWTAVTVSAAGPSSLTCTVSNPSPTVGQQVTYTANGGNIGDTYTWTASDGWAGTSGVTASTINRTFNSAGAFGMQVTDSGVNANCPVVTAGNVCSAPSATISANPTRVRSGSTTSIGWSASGVTTSCTITGPGVNQTVPANSCTVSPSSVTTPPITAQSVYAISCDGGATKNQVIVNVIPALQEF